MALHWDTTAVNKDAFTWDENERSEQYGQELETMVWNTMFLGINKVTADNWKDFYARYVIFNWDRKPADLFVTPDMCKRWIGLSTNATNYTRAAFNKGIIERMEKWARGLAK